MTLTGTIDSVRYQNPDNGWSAVTVRKKDGGLLPASGIMPGVKKGMYVTMEGELENTVKYGVNFKATSFSESRPSDAEGIYKYLSSGLIKNIGPVFAKAIVDAFGEETLDVLDNNPERLKEITGIGPKRIKSVITALKDQKAIRGIMIWLKRYDLTNTLATKIYKTYGDDSVALLEENPYRLSDDIKGIGFKRADTVARQLGLPEDSPFRILSGLRAVLEDAASKGHTYVNREILCATAASPDYLDLPDRQPIREALDRMDFIQVGVIDDDRVSLPMYHYAEIKIAKRIHSIMKRGLKDPSAMPDFARIESETGILFSGQQQDAITLALRNPMMIMTGGPGTGKTTTTNAIINECLRRGYKVVLAAPTGRAAKRMTESTGKPAKTIHRLLEYSHGEFSRNEENPIEANVIILDEASMIDTLLMKDFLKAVSDRTKVVIVGDIDQLPSVGAGCVLRDLIASGVIPTLQLTQIYRQALGSDIVRGAHSVNRGALPTVRNVDGSDLWMFPIENKERVSDIIVELVQTRIPRKFGYSSDDIQVLSPMRRDWDPIGATVLNQRLQEALNPDGKKVATKGYCEFRVGDRIMQTKNNYDKDVFNGDIGIVTRRVDPDENTLTADGDDDNAVMEAEFDGRAVRFSQEDLGDLTLSYACTIHKSQGSEYPAVVIPVHESQFIMLKRNLLYTGITRAKRLCVLVGTMKAVAIAVGRPDTDVRNTYLKERLIEKD